jgi:hypothetical protein
MNPLHEAQQIAQRERAMRQVWQGIAITLALACVGIGIAAGAAQDRVRERATVVLPVAAS